MCYPFVIHGIKSTRLKYEKNNIRYMAIRLEDSHDAQLLPVLDRAIKWISTSLHSKIGGHVLIHCQAGVSRSASVVCAWLIHAHRLTLPSAISLLKLARPIIKPNIGFMKQLEIYERDSKDKYLCATRKQLYSYYGHAHIADSIISFL